MNFEIEWDIPNHSLKGAEHLKPKIAQICAVVSEIKFSYFNRKLMRGYFDFYSIFSNTDM